MFVLANYEPLTGRSSFERSCDSYDKGMEACRVRHNISTPDSALTVALSQAS